MQDVEDYVAEKRDKKQGNRGEDRSKKFSAINLRPAERAEQTDYQQHSPNSKEQKVRPRKIARDWKSGEELIRKQPRAYDHDADPDRPIPFFVSSRSRRWQPKNPAIQSDRNRCESKATEDYSSGLEAGPDQRQRCI